MVWVPRTVSAPLIGAAGPERADLAVTVRRPRSMIAAMAFRNAYLMLARMLSWLALLARSHALRTSRSSCSVTRSPYFDDEIHAPR